MFLTGIISFSTWTNIRGNKMIFFECNADETLLKFLLDDFPKDIFDHKHGKGNVLKWIFEIEDCVGLVDRDADSFQYRKYYEKLETLENSNHYRYTLFHVPNGNKVLELDPKLEEWILRISKLENANLERYGLSQDINRFKEQVNLNPQKLEKLLKALEDSEHILKLKEILKQNLS